ncbi:MAG: AMP-binding protein, partial [SAR324 cluster bacterium]|nr:AMP-binding protein [SAR324 cluster bacterium]
IIFYYGVLKTGAVAITVSAQVTPDELAYLFNHSRPKIIFTTDDKLDVLSKLEEEGGLEKIISPGSALNFAGLLEMGSRQFKVVDRDRKDTASVLYTGGTTGSPKGVMLTHENISTAIHNVVFDERSQETDRIICFLPLNHSFGQMHILNATILSAGCVEVMPSFDLERVLHLMKSGRITKLMAVPTIYVRLLALEDLETCLGSIRYCFSAGASMAADLVRQWKERTGLDIYEGYGMTEAAPTVTYNHHFKHVIGSVGTEVPGVEVQLRDMNGTVLRREQEGEICVRGRNIMKGYLDNPQATKAAFWDGEWFRSGDIGHFDDAGYLYIVDRLKDMIITGGENVYSREVEDVLYTRPEIEECAVIGLPDPEWGERVVASLTLKPGWEIDPKELTIYLKKHLSAFKVPKEFHITSQLPKSAVGKILKRELRKQFIP